MGAAGIGDPAVGLVTSGIKYSVKLASFGSF